MTHATNPELEALQEVAQALQEHDRLKDALRASEARLRALCREYDKVGRQWGTSPDNLRQTCLARGLIKKEPQP